MTDHARRASIHHIDPSKHRQDTVVHAGLSHYSRCFRPSISLPFSVFMSGDLLVAMLAALLPSVTWSNYSGYCERLGPMFYRTRGEQGVFGLVHNVGVTAYEVKESRSGPVCAVVVSGFPSRIEVH